MKYSASKENQNRCFELIKENELVGCPWGLYLLHLFVYLLLCSNLSIQLFIQVWKSKSNYKEKKLNSNQTNEAFWEQIVKW